MSHRVAVIGSGLSAIGAIKALRSRGIRPVVIDRGEQLDDARADKVASMAKRHPSQWTEQELHDLNDNQSLKDGSAIPKKLVFSSDYFYGKPSGAAPVELNEHFPPFSYALGGFSAGWGAAVLPPQACDLSEWPVDAEELVLYCEKVLAGLPYSARDDGLSLNFPLLSSGCKSLRPSRAEHSLLSALERTSILKKGKIVFGQARLLVDAVGIDHGCRYCGECMSGCVYGAIYKAGDEILALHNEGKIEYLSGHLVQRLAERDEEVVVTSIDAEGVQHRMRFDQVFLAAGAVNSTRLVLDSLNMFKQEARLLSRSGFVIPMLNLRGAPLDWPASNTQPGLFLELKGKWLDRWVHVQISAENELVLRKLGVTATGNGVLARVKRFIASHVVILFVNYHSDHAGHYKLWLEPTANNTSASRLYSKHVRSLPQFKVWFASWFRLLAVFLRIGCIPLFPLAKLNSGAYHVGGTLPMKKNPLGNLETDTLGKLSAWKNIHIVDTSVFSSLPGTTVGLLTMANAYRIADKASSTRNK